MSVATSHGDTGDEVSASEQTHKEKGGTYPLSNEERRDLFHLQGEGSCRKGLPPKEGEPRLEHNKRRRRRIFFERGGCRDLRITLPVSPKLLRLADSDSGSLIFIGSLISLIARIGLIRNVLYK